ncbi:hypothetical protein [Streptomyces hydrogenans]|uniref:Uncharacterized protein n=1 Tax=Streptomyces hydrogenans TaxID=1873719 RepID=A0ABQ3PIB1_9ACTN|nr:hypothetical protein [Streptomyces hydrogenans]GHG04082.1 hypothetical protein GCM10018784_15480 [Streptomyces hydrogenans]GHI24746.1 hypothetical protein Shyd_61170 [Streptomyces hydrogenans]
MPLALFLIALFALAFLVFDVVLCFRAWRMTGLPRWRRILPALPLPLPLPLRAALPASAGRAWGVTRVAEAVASPSNAATALLGRYETDRRRRRRERPEAAV